MKMFVSNREIEAQEKREQEANNPPMVLPRLVQLVLTAWQSAKMTKEQKVEKRMTEALRMRAGEYDAQKLAAIQENNGSTIYMRIVDEKCMAAEALLMDSLEKPWDVQSTPIPELRPEHEAAISQRVLQDSLSLLKQELNLRVQLGEIQTSEQASQWLQTNIQEEVADVKEQIRSALKLAAQRADDKAQEKIDDVLTEGGWYDALGELVYDVVTFPTGFIKGPVIRKNKQLTWQEGGPCVTMKPAITFNSPSPFDIYPLSDSVTLQDGLIERHRLTRSDLQALLGVPGYDTAAIIEVLNEAPGTSNNWLLVANDQAKESLQDRPFHTFHSDRETYDGLQYWKPVSGGLLREYGFSQLDPLQTYSCEIWLVGRHIIKVELNGDPLGRVPYYGVSYRRKKGSIWGSGVPDLISDTQEAANNTGRNILNNVAASAGPQSAVDINSVESGETIEGFRPFKVWLFNSAKLAGQSSGRKPVEFFVPPSVAEQLIKVYQFFSQEADNRTGVPRYAYGANAGGGISDATKTATGMSMMLNNTLKGIKHVIRNFDSFIIKPSIQHTFEMLLLFWQCPELMQGDINLRAVGAHALINKEVAQMRKKELLQLSLGSEWVMNKLGDVGATKLLREVFRTADFAVDDIIPSDTEVQHNMTMSKLQQRLMLLQEQAAAQTQHKSVNEAGHAHAGKDFQLV